MDNKNTVNHNKFWNEYGWYRDGDEWDDQAEFCNQPYDKWKQSFTDFFLIENFKDKNILEIGCGHGRWSEPLIQLSKTAKLVDLNESCIEFCEEKFQNNKNCDFYKTNGSNLDFIRSNSIDAIWSYDTFVHIDEETFVRYLNEFKRVLKKSGIVLIHYSQGSVTGSTPDGGNYVQRSKFTPEKFLEMVDSVDLKVDYQKQTLCSNNEFNCKLFNDYIAKLVNKT